MPTNDVGTLGREVTLDLGALTILGMQTKGLTVNNEAVDVTDDDSGGWATVLSRPGQKSVEMPFSGIVKDLILVQAALTDENQTRAVTLTYPSGATVTGNFFLGSYSETGEYNGAFTFDATLTSSGEVTFTPAPAGP
jgi:predicted secreted protein